MKAQTTTIILNNRWGYCYTPEIFISKRQALVYANEMIKEGYAFSYRIINK